MGQRGPNSARLKAARLGRDKPRRFPWLKPGQSRAERVIRFVQWLPVTKGVRAGKRMKLLPHQIEFIEEVFAEDREVQVELAISSVARGNGKTGLGAPLGLCALFGPEAEVRGEVYSAAIDRQQAGIMFAEMEAIILAVPEFAQIVNIQRFHKRIEVLEGPGEGSIYEALSADARRAHGLAPLLWFYDELAQAKDRELLDNLMTALGKRARSLGIIISTQAPNDAHPLSQLIDDGLTGVDPSIFVQLISAPEDADPFDEKVLRDCNPALGKFLEFGTLKKQQQQAQRIPAFEPRFRNLRLNQRVDANPDARIVTRSVWDLGDVDVDLERLLGRRCYGGLDLSGKHDLTSLELVFPDDEPEVGYDVLSFFWTPLGQMEARTTRERDLFRQWIDEGLIEGVPGPTIRYRYIADKLAELSQMFDILKIGYDRWRIDDLKIELDDVGCEVELEPFGQGYKDMAPAVERFVELALTGNIRHGGNKVLTACVANAILISDPAGNQKIDKKKSNRTGVVRIDGAVALAMAIGVASRDPDEGPSEYETRGLRRINYG